MPVSTTYTFLIGAIVAEVVATTALARAESFTRLGPSLVAVGGYAIAFYCLSHPLRVMPAGVVYAVWSGFGIVFIALIGRVFLGQRLDGAAIVGIALILAGVVIINVFSTSSEH